MLEEKGNDLKSGTDVALSKYRKSISDKKDSLSILYVRYVDFILGCTNIEDVYRLTSNLFHIVRPYIELYDIPIISIIYNSMKTSCKKLSKNADIIYRITGLSIYFNNNNDEYGRKYQLDSTSVFARWNGNIESLHIDKVPQYSDVYECTMLCDGLSSRKYGKGGNDLSVHERNCRKRPSSESEILYAILLLSTSDSTQRKYLTRYTENLLNKLNNNSFIVHGLNGIDYAYDCDSYILNIVYFLIVECENIDKQMDFFVKHYRFPYRFCNKLEQPIGNRHQYVDRKVDLFRIFSSIGLVSLDVYYYLQLNEILPVINKCRDLDEKKILIDKYADMLKNYCDYYCMTNSSLLQTQIHSGKNNYDEIQKEKETYEKKRKAKLPEVGAGGGQDAQHSEEVIIASKRIFNAGNLQEKMGKIHEYKDRFNQYELSRIIIQAITYESGVIDGLEYGLLERCKEEKLLTMDDIKTINDSLTQIKEKREYYRNQVEIENVEIDQKQIRKEEEKSVILNPVIANISMFKPSDKGNKKQIQQGLDIANKENIPKQPQKQRLTKKQL